MAPLRTHGTPNPNAIKFTRDEGPFIDAGLIAASAPSDAEEHPLAQALFAVDGVESLLIMPQFVTVTKEPDVSWDKLLDEVSAILDEAEDA